MLVLSAAAMVIAWAGILQFTAVEAMAQAAQLKEVVIKPTPVEGGQPIEVIIYLTKRGNTWVKLNSSNNNIIPVQPNMPVHLNNVSIKSVFLDTNIITGSSQCVTINVTTGAVQKQAIVSVTPQGASSGGAYSIYQIKGSELGKLYTLAQSKGWTFTAKSATFSDDQRCTLDTDKHGIELTVIQPDHCYFELFGGSHRLNTGWTLDKFVWTRLPKSKLALAYNKKPQFGTDNLYFKIYFAPNTLTLFGYDYEHLLEIWLKGPKGAKWQDAFE